MLAVAVNTLLIVAVFAGIGWLLKRMFVDPQGPVMVCTQCGHHGFTVRRVKGSTGIELILWLCFLVPGLIYSVWRMSSRRPVCTACGSSALVPPSSPVGQRMLGATSSAPDSPQAART